MMEFLVLGQIPGTDLTLDFWSVMLLWLLAIVIYKGRKQLFSVVFWNRQKRLLQEKLNLISI